jgi:hypothetical protein
VIEGGARLELGWERRVDAFTSLIGVCRNRS